MTYLGLDLGSKTLGLSISDRTGLIASSLEVLRYSTYDELLSMLEHVINDRKVDALVLGNPLNLDGSLSKRSEETLKFMELLRLVALNASWNYLVHGIKSIMRNPFT